MNLPPQALKIELTESTFVGEEKIANDTIMGLKDMGIKIAIDDFGTGYSSLSYIHRMPIDTIKIDRSLVSGNTNSEKKKYILQSIISMAKRLKIEVVAEGIESQHQLNYLKASDCDLAQGFYFSHPLPPKAVADFINGAEVPC